MKNPPGGLEPKTLSGKVVVVTGAAKGIGFHITQQFVFAGARNSEHNVGKKDLCIELNVLFLLDTPQISNLKHLY